MTYEVIYRMGGTHHCVWRRVPTKYITKDKAEVIARQVKSSGYHSEVKTTDELESIGLPVGWTFDAVDWENDTVTVNPYETVHIKRG